MNCLPLVGSDTERNHLGRWSVAHLSCWKLQGMVSQFSELLHHNSDTVSKRLCSLECSGKDYLQYECRIIQHFAVSCYKSIRVWYVCVCGGTTNMWPCGHVCVLAGSQLAACEVCRLVLIRLLTVWPWSLSQDEISWLTDSSLSHLIDRGVDRICLPGAASIKRRACTQMSLTWMYCIQVTCTPTKWWTNTITCLPSMGV